MKDLGGDHVSAIGRFSGKLRQCKLVHPERLDFPRDKAPLYIYMYTVNILKGGLSEKWEGFATCVNQTFLEG